MFELSKNTGSSVSCLLLWSLLSRTATATAAAKPLNLAVDHHCGMGGAAARSPRIIGGKVAARGQFPWAVRLMKKTNGANSLRPEMVHCGGSLITAWHVVTAAHCVSDTSRKPPVTLPSDWQVVAGELDTGARAIGRQVKSIKQHPDYKFPFIAHDLAILTLDASFNWTSLVSPVCLPSSTHDDFSARMAELAGWGDVNPRFRTGHLQRDGTTSQELMFTRVEVLRNQECSLWLKEERERRILIAASNPGNATLKRDIPPPMRIHKNQLCTGSTEPGSGGCHGDSGGPLTVLTAAHTLAGVVSGGGRVCGQPRVPSIYTRVAHYAHWLQNVTQEIHTAP